MMQKQHKVGVVILNWNGLEITKRCLESLFKQTYKDFETIVIDNGSSDGSVNWLGRNKEINLIINETNQGFAKAINQGINKAIDDGCSYVVGLNNDTELDKEWLFELINFMDSNPDISLAQGATMQLGDKTLFDSSGIYLEKGFVPNQRALGQDSPRLDMAAIGPNAAGAIYRTSSLEDVKIANGDFFDSRFFAYVEDVDLDLRFFLRGYKFAFVPSAKLYHAGSYTGNKIAHKKMYWGARNLVWLVYKNVPVKVLRQTWKLIVRSHAANLQFLWREQRGNFLSYLKGLFVGLVSIPRFIKDRQVNLKAQRVDNTEFLDTLVPSNPPLTNPFKRILNLLK